MPQKTDRRLVESVRVKRWGKSPPRSWQQLRHGKPRQEQGHVEGRLRAARSMSPGRLLEGSGNAAPRGMIITRWQAIANGDRTRLIVDWSRIDRRKAVDVLFGTSRFGMSRLAANHSRGRRLVGYCAAKTNGTFTVVTPLDAGNRQPRTRDAMQLERPR